MPSSLGRLPPGSEGQRRLTELTFSLLFPSPRWILVGTSLAPSKIPQKCLWLAQPRHRELRPSSVRPHRTVRCHFPLSLISCNSFFDIHLLGQQQCAPRRTPTRKPASPQLWKLEVQDLRCHQGRLHGASGWLCLSSHGFHTTHARVQAWLPLIIKAHMRLFRAQLNDPTSTYAPL